MVKGITKKIVMIKAPEGEFFEEAIFIIRDDVLRRGTVSRDKILEEACRVANGHLNKKPRKKIRDALFAPLFAVIGALGMGLIWLATIFLL